MNSDTNELVDLLKSNEVSPEQKAIIIEELLSRQEIVLDRIEYLH